MGYSKFNIDFISKTIKILESYEILCEKEIEENTGYEITLALNCMLGLAVFPEGAFYASLNDEIRFDVYLGTIEGVQYMGNIPTFKQGAIKIRNICAHFGDTSGRYDSTIKLNNLDFNSLNEIERVDRIEISTGNDEHHFKVIISLITNKLCFNEFLIELCKKMSSGFNI